ncbi:MAG: glycosyl hydrolase family 28 protein [Chitinophagaceae bacterium]
MTDEQQQVTTRRSMIARGGALLGTCLLAGSSMPVNAQVSKADSTDPIDIKKFGASGKRTDNATKAFRDALEAAAARGGGTVNVPPGEYTVGTIQLKDNVTLNIEAGATLFLSQLKQDYFGEAPTMLYAEDAKNISVTGRGTLDGLAQYDYAEMRGLDPEIVKEVEIAKAAGMDMRRYYRKSSAQNAYMFVINNCTNFSLSDITIINTPFWAVRVNDCNRVFIRSVQIYSDLEKGVNSDGIDIVSTSNVTISDSVIVTADDSIVIKTIPRNGKKANPSENITVTNCILSSSSTPLMIGTETHADIKHVVFNNCVIRNSNKGFGINVQDGATVSNVIFSNLTIETNRRHWNWWGDAEICKFILRKRTDASSLGMIKDILIENVIAHVRGTGTIKGHPDQPLQNITFSNVQVFMLPEDSKDKRSTHALHVQGVEGLKVRDFSVKWADEAEPKWQSALVLKNVTDFVIDSFSGRQGLKNGEDAAIVLDDATDGIIRNSIAPAGTNIFVEIKGNPKNSVSVKGNETRKAKKAFFYEKVVKKQAG